MYNFGLAKDFTPENFKFQSFKRNNFTNIKNLIDFVVEHLPLIISTVNKQTLTKILWGMGQLKLIDIE